MLKIFLPTMLFRSCAVLLATFGSIAISHAQAIKPPTVFDVWAKTTVPGGRVSAAYMHIKSATPVTLVSAESTAAEVVVFAQTSNTVGGLIAWA